MAPECVGARLAQQKCSLGTLPAANALAPPAAQNGVPPPLTRAIACPVLQERKASPLQRGGTLQGAAAAGKDASEKFKSMAEGAAGSGPVLQV